MAPSAVPVADESNETSQQTSLVDKLKQKLHVSNGTTVNASASRAPLKLSGALDKFKHFEVTPVIGREYVDVDLAEWLRAPNSDELIRDLAITGKLRA